ncbi:MAG: DNA topoisomerase [Acidobacteria bacterium]|nr:DNA topoisomerase [Acidobacteriota bacterium]
MHRTQEAIQKHLEAIRSPLYEIGVFFPAASAGADSKMLLRTWDEVTIFKSVPWLRAKNTEGAAIYIRPKGEHPYSLVDDLTAEAVHRMRQEGYMPAIVVETSPGNFQAWLNHGETLDRRTSTQAARALAERFGGDPGAADWRHFGRLAGFTNRKPAYSGRDGLFPFVRIVEFQPGVYPMAPGFVGDVRRTEIEQRRVPRNSSASAHRGSLSIDDFRADPRYSGDGNRIDLAYALYALGHGGTEDAVGAAIRTRDLSKKGSEARQSAYVARTIEKARTQLGSSLRR